MAKEELWITYLYRTLWRNLKYEYIYLNPQMVGYSFSMESKITSDFITMNGGMRALIIKLQMCFSKTTSMYPDPPSFDKKLS